jgi:hypothetical protein
VLEAIDATTLFVEWNSTESVEGFEIEVLEEGADILTMDPFAGSTLEAIISGLAPEGTYWLQIRSFREGLYSEWMISKAITMPKDDGYTPSHYWDFDDAESGTAFDAGIYPHDLDTTSVSSGDGIDAGSRAIVFDNEHKGVGIPDSEVLNTADVSALTISFWFKPDVDADQFNSMIYEQGGYWRGLNIILANGWLQASGWNRPSKESDWEGTTLNGGKLVPGQWTHIALVLNGTETVQEGGLVLYVNGVAVDAGPASKLWKQNDDNGIGQVKKSTSYRGRQVRKLDPLQGSLDDLAIWSIALTNEEVESIYLPEN